MVNAADLDRDVALFAPDCRLTDLEHKLLLAFKMRNVRWLGMRTLHSLIGGPADAVVHSLTVKQMVIPFNPYFCAITKKGELIVHIYTPLTTSAVIALWRVSLQDYSKPFPRKDIALLKLLGYIQRDKKRWELTPLGRHIINP